MAVGLDREVSMLVVEDAPQSATLPHGTPADLVHIQRLRATQTLKQIAMGQGKRLAHAIKDHLDRTRADARAEQLFAYLYAILTGDAVTHPQHRHYRFKARPEGATNKLIQ